MLTVRQIFDDLLGTLGVDNPDTSSATLRTSALGYITAGLQLMQTAGEDFCCREPLSVSMTSGTSPYTLDKTVQKVLFPARLSTGATLKVLTSRTQLDDFGPLFLGQVSRTVPNGTPIACFVESLRETASDKLSDSVAILLHVVPKPSGSMTLTVDAIKEPPTYTASDLCGTSPVPPVPHKYHESILLPICRMNATTSPHFARHKDKLPQIQTDYLRALTLLGLADPRKPKPDDSNSNRLKALASKPDNGQQ